MLDAAFLTSHRHREGVEDVKGFGGEQSRVYILDLCRKSLEQTASSWQTFDYSLR
jgi:hypothetical protein